MIFKKYTPFTDCISKTNKVQVDNTYRKIVKNILQQQEMYRDELHDNMAIPNHSDLS